MAPKKRDKHREGSKGTNVDQFKTDHELFLHAFEKPTQIYRFLGSRQLVSPIFLQRSLIYMRQRMSRSHKHRKNFKVDSILDRVRSQQILMLSERPSGNLTLTFTGYYDKANKATSDTVCVEATLLKICHKKRKEASSPLMKVSVGKCDVFRNPDLSNPPAKATAISIPSDYFNLSNGHLVKSYVLLLRTLSTNGRNKLNGMCNGDASDISDEPPQKKRKNIKVSAEDSHYYGAELVVYDKQQRCLLTDGEYQLSLQECGQKSSPRKTSTWETFPEAHENALGLFDVFTKGPLVTLTLTWSNDVVNGIVDRPLPAIKPSDFGQNGLRSLNARSPVEERPKKMRIFYQFLYNNNTRQQTEARDDLHCPWCKVNCIELYCLLKHLKLCHNRFTFHYVPHPKGARIDVCINESYDGSYVGNPHDLHSQTGFAFSRSGPVRRNPVTHVMVCRPKRYPPSLSEFLEITEEGVAEADAPRSYISGHNRVYYHTGTCHTVRPQAIDIDSEGENDPEWLRFKTQHMIDEFTDVNEGEKELMKMWNLHVMKHGFVGDCQIPVACSMFIEEHGRTIIQNCLYHNFLLHLCNLFDFGLISASVVYHTMRQLMQLRDDLNSDNKLHQRTS